MNIGYIYKITNLINGKMYIGQTSRPYKTRLLEHKKDAFDVKHKGYNCHFYKAIRKYGFENFAIEVIEECDISLLDDKEIYYINLYNTYNNGYNDTLGGYGSKKLNLDESIVINQYKTHKTITKVAQINNCSKSSIQNILKKNNINITSAIQHQKEKGLTIYQYTLDNVLINTFQTRYEIGKWLIENNKSNAKTPYSAGESIYSILRRGKHICFGYYWKLENDYNDDYKKENIQKYKNRKNTKIQYITKNDKKNIKKNICPICNKNLKSLKSKICQECSNKLLSEQFTKEREQKISREELKQLIRTTPFTKIGEQFGVSDNAIRKWCTRYDLPTKSSEIKKYTNEEWENI